MSLIQISLVWAILLSLTGPQCKPAISKWTVVYPLPQIISLTSGNLNNIICASDPPLSLFADPPGDQFSGNGVINNVFYSNVSGVGNQMIQYFYKNQTTGCSNFGQFSLTVVDNPALAIYG